MPRRTRLPWALRASIRLLAKPIRRPGLPRLAFVTLTGSPRTIRARGRAVFLLRRMYKQHGLSSKEVEELERLLNQYPRVAWADKLPITWRDEQNISHIHWWHRPQGEKHEHYP